MWQSVISLNFFSSGRDVPVPLSNAFGYLSGSDLRRDQNSSPTQISPTRFTVHIPTLSSNQVHRHRSPETIVVSSFVPVSLV